MGLRKIRRLKGAGARRASEVDMPTKFAVNGARKPPVAKGRR